MQPEQGGERTEERVLDPRGSVFRHGGWRTKDYEVLGSTLGLGDMQVVGDSAKKSLVAMAA